MPPLKKIERSDDKLATGGLSLIFRGEKRLLSLPKNSKADECSLQRGVFLQILEK
jgi:hypothetical protein